MPKIAFPRRRVIGSAPIAIRIQQSVEIMLFRDGGRTGKE
jgi:hypothetical protein